ncbi:hypothetical protein HK097_006585 [Rhizophlyctis rosea]|uniref:Uncharacterized protein n=1 Tax=Rhizophlyctis rosea TaxID=64517 RepID=A0AAD5WVT1_9FUNG|nr:hypothetical protein HK097_006585 [Rhizophlyctis rosea]
MPTAPVVPAVSSAAAGVTSKGVGLPLLVGMGGSFGLSGPEELTSPAVVHAMKWLSDLYVPDADGIVSPNDLMILYNDTVTNVGHKAVTPDKLTALLSVVFPAITLEMSDGMPLLKGIRGRLEKLSDESAATSVDGDIDMEDPYGPASTIDQMAMNTPDEMSGGPSPKVVSAALSPLGPSFPCYWGGTSTQSGCGIRCGSEAELVRHVQEIHLPGGLERYECRWKGCRALDGLRAVSTRGRMLAHLATHAPLAAVPSKTIPLSSLGVNASPANASAVPTFNPLQPFPPLPHAYNIYAANPYAIPPPLGVAPPPAVVDEDLKGIPLTTLLVLRNLARHPGNRELFGGLEGVLAHMMMTQGRFAGGLARVLAELR